MNGPKTFGLRRRVKEFGIFLRGFFKEPLRVSTGLQSSRFMAKTFERALHDVILSDGCVVELGAGCGRLTEKIVERLGTETRLLCFELEPLYAGYLRRKFGHDTRVTVIEDRAENLRRHLTSHGFASVPTIVSAVPLLSGRKDCGLLRTIHDGLSEGGRMIQMALLRRRDFENKEFTYVRRHVCLLNLPPEVLHVCEKRTCDA
jgi:phospholipid N-methyltransferase